jgi:DNA-binding NtrC family response regulator
VRVQNVLVVDDEQVMRQFLEDALGRLGKTVEVASSAGAAMQILARRGFDLVITDVRMPGTGGLTLLQHVRRAHPGTLVVALTAYATVEDAVAAMKAGAADYLSKPISPELLEILLRKLEERAALVDENRYLRDELHRDSGVEALVGQGREISVVRKLIGKVAPSDATVLVTGESGTGKELVARAVHTHCKRARGAFIRVNSAALPESILESELFGHEKGAFTGASSRRRGRFELADGGTLFLDEISETSQALQAKLLRVIQEREFERVGGTNTVRVDIRLVASTNRDLGAMVREGRFREDLSYRLNVVEIHLPPLRERLEDIPVLATHFLRRMSRQNGRGEMHLSEGALQRLCSYHWPGNVRELENCIHRAVVLCESDKIEPVHLGNLQGRVGRAATTMSGAPVFPLRVMEKNTILRALEITGGNRRMASALLGVSERTVYKKLRRYRNEPTCSSFMQDSEEVAARAGDPIAGPGDAVDKSRGTRDAFRDDFAKPRWRDAALAGTATG